MDETLAEVILAAWVGEMEEEPPGVGVETPRGRGVECAPTDGRSGGRLPAAARWGKGSSGRGSLLVESLDGRMCADGWAEWWSVP